MLERKPDQATGLRALFEPQPGLTLLPMAHIRRGMGTTTAVINLAAALARDGERPIVVDGAARGVAHALSLRLPWDLSDVLSGECEWRDVAAETLHGVYVARAQRALGDLAGGALAALELRELYGRFRRSDPPLDVAIFVGSMREMTAITAAGDEIVVVTGPDEIALRATYAELKRAYAEHRHAAFRVVVNRADDDKAGHAAFRRLADTTRRFVGIDIEYGGTLPRDAAFVAADRAVGTVFDVAPAGVAAQQVNGIVRSMRSWRLSRYTENQ